MDTELAKLIALTIKEDKLTTQKPLENQVLILMWREDIGQVLLREYQLQISLLFIGASDTRICLKIILSKDW